MIAMELTSFLSFPEHLLNLENLVGLASSDQANQWKVESSPFSIVYIDHQRDH